MSNMGCLFALLLGSPITACAVNAQDVVFSGDCDASTAIATGKDTFFAIGDEKKPQLRRYKTTGEFLGETKLKGFLDAGTEDLEPDLEASAKVKDTIFVMGSHGRDDEGVLCPERSQLFAFKYSIRDGQIALKQVGSSYTNLQKHLLNHKAFECLALDTTPRVNNSDLAPKLGKSINVEGLTPSKDGEDLWVGLRTPLFSEKAIIIPIKNPFKLVKGKAKEPNFGEAILVDLNKQGIRSIEYWTENDCYLIVSGNVGDTRGFQVFTWTGAANNKPVRIINALDEQQFNPEAIVVFPGEKSRFMILSDDGTRKYGEEKCKKLEKEKRCFTGRWYSYKK